MPASPSMNVMLLMQAPVLAYPLSSVIKPDFARSCEISTAVSASVPTTVGNSMLLSSYVSVAFFVMGPPTRRSILRGPLRRSGGAAPVCGARLADGHVSQSRGEGLQSVSRVLYLPPFSLRADGLPTQVTTELPGNEQTMGSEPLDDR